MKRNYSAVLSLLLAGGICCTGCAKAGGEATAAQKLGGSFTTEMTMTMEDWTAAGTLSRLGDGAWERVVCRALRLPVWCWTFPAGK